MIEEWNRRGAPPGRTGPLNPERGWYMQNPAEKGQGKGRSVPPPRANPYTDIRLNRGSAAGAPPQPEPGYGPARKGGCGQPQGCPQPPGVARNTRPRTAARPAGAPPARSEARTAAHREPPGAGGPPALPKAGAPARGEPRTRTETDDGAGPQQQARRGAEARAGPATRALAACSATGVGERGGRLGVGERGGH